MAIIYSRKEQKKTKKTIFTLNIDNYAPEITKLTYPFIEKYAEKINAEFKIITERKFSGYPLIYEKLQIYELGSENDWNIYIDSDCLIHPDMFDFAEVLPEDTVLNYGSDFASQRFRYDNYFRRDGRNIGSISSITAASRLGSEIWEPLSDMTAEEALRNIKIFNKKMLFGHPKGYGIDDYVISRNIAKYGMKFKTFPDLINEIRRAGDEYIYHESSIGENDKAEKIKEKLKDWKFN